MGAGFDPGDDGVVVVEVTPNQGEEFGGHDVIGEKEISVPAAAIHHARGHLTPEFRFGLGNDPGEPANA